jgi:ProP effector
MAPDFPEPPAPSSGDAPAPSPADAPAPSLADAPVSSPAEQAEPSSAAPAPAPRDDASAARSADAAAETATGDAPSSPPAEPDPTDAPSSEQPEAAASSTGEAGPTEKREPADAGPRLRALFPALFGNPPKPLKLRIQQDIQQRAPGQFSKQALSAFLRRHTGSHGYLVALANAKTRFGLDGEAAGEVSAEHRQAAVEELARRRANRQARVELDEQQRRNRATLLRDFETTTLTRANFCALKGVPVDELDGLLERARHEAQERGHERAPERGPRPRHEPGARRMPSAGERRRRPGRRLETRWT